MTHPCPKTTRDQDQEPCAVCDPCCQHCATDLCVCDLDHLTDAELAATYARCEKASEKVGHTGGE